MRLTPDYSPGPKTVEECGCHFCNLAAGRYDERDLGIQAHFARIQQVYRDRNLKNVPTSAMDNYRPAGMP